jgi:WD40 repeat protein
MRVDASIQQVYSGHADALYCLERGRDNLLYSGGGDCFIGTWDIVSGAFLEPLAKMPATIYSLLAHPDRPTIYSGLQNGTLFTLDTDARSIEKSLQLSTQGIFSLALLQEGKLLAAASGEGFIYLLDTADNSLVQSLNLTDKAIRTLSVSPCGRFLIAGASDHKIYFLHMDDELVLEQVIDAHDNSVFTAIYKEGYVLLSGGRDAMLKQWTWDGSKREWQAGDAVPAHNYTINRIAPNPGGRIFATASRDKTIKIWNTETLDLLKVINLEKHEAGHTHSVNTLLWLDENNLLSAGDDKRIIRWRFNIQ